MVQRSAAKRVKTHLERHIAAGTPGDRVPSVRQLMAELGVSPATVRSAVAQLVRDGELDTISGSGTFIARRLSRQPTPGDRSWQTVALGSTDVPGDFLAPLRPPSGPGIIDLASGYPDTGLQPTQLIAKSLRDVSRRPETFDRAPPHGIPALRRWFMSQLGPDTDHQVVIVAGGQAALSLCFRSIGLPGDNILMEAPTYIGAIGAARAAGLNPVPVPCDRDGVMVDELAKVASRHNATLVYLQPRFHNPTGARLSSARRQTLMELAAAEGLIIIEDDWLRDLDNPETAPRPLASDDPDGHVIHIASLTKSVSPAMRIAGVSATGSIARRLQATRSIEDFFVSPLLQETAVTIVTDPAWQRHLRRLRVSVAQRQAVLRSELMVVDPVSAASAVGGPLHVWFEIRAPVDNRTLQRTALSNGVATIAGDEWHPGDAASNHIRLSNAAATPHQIETGVQLFAKTLEQIQQ